MVEFDMSEELATLTIAIFVVGYCVGPLLWGPLSESYGRRPIFIIAFVFYTIWQVAAALSRSTGQILVFRFLGGTFAAAPLTNAGAVLADIWDADTRGEAMAIFTLAPFAGPALGPIVSGYMSVAHVTWRWLFWLLSIFAGACTVAIIFCLPETYTPVLLVSRAKTIRLKTGETRYFAALERAEVSLRKRLSLVLGRPFKILFLEPMLIAITIYMSFGHGMNSGVSGLMFLPLFLGGCAGVALYIWGFNPRYERFMRMCDPRPVPPERRLEMAIVGGPLFAISFFWFGWTSYPSISFWSPMMATFPLGIGITLIFLSLFNYIIDAYLLVAASALAGSTVVRSSFGAGFPMFATQMFDKLSPRWPSTLLGCIALLMIPIPVILMRYGAFLRRKSKYSPTD
ncbi:MFS general substrate transporter [Dacryopinax primogenitus]|uniref:MFS general substrate transporter n=1 Tax=Dacryopinax primogenitus (strain DJM 731) TaxID=1858805 RepID=M5FRY3_DACPD|nr:MFS general substrate transporter [Dacryopinax primogenitus]EJT97844.1 MFS general substrate transporter [Dacryopinax primogenitus]